MTSQTTDHFNWLDIPARTRKQWWSLSTDNKARVYAYYRKLWYLMQESGDE